MNLAVVQHFRQHLGLGLDVGQVLAGKLRLDVGQLQTQNASLTADIQNQPQELPLRPLPGLFRVLCPALCGRPTIPVNDRLPGVACRGTAVPVRHPTNRQVCVFQIVHNGLRVGLVQFRSNAVDLGVFGLVKTPYFYRHAALCQFFVLAIF